MLQESKDPHCNRNLVLLVQQKEQGYVEDADMAPCVGAFLWGEIVVINQLSSG